RGRAASTAVRLGGPDGAAAYVHVLAGEPRDDDVAVLRRARRARGPAGAGAGGGPDGIPIPDRAPADRAGGQAGEGRPPEAIARAIAGAMGEHGAPLAARVPLLREAVSERLVASFARRNGVLAAVPWRGADLPLLALNQLRLVLRIAQAYGAADDPP